jgi:D-alanyl-D-alanine carboxypeptidase/D-alanyl-D-alanine-endopeptidase (penicillin-binding protein 4)
MKIKTILLIFVSCFFINADRYDDVKTEINNVLNKLPAGTRIGMLIYNPLTRDTIYSINHTESMIPASNTKLFTTATALEIMGGSYTLSTQILTDDNDLTDGKIDGNIYIKGLGNSVFTSEDLTEMANGLFKLGIKEITGNVIGDDTFFDDVYTRDDWIKDENANVRLAPISAVVIDRNKTRVKKKSRGRLRTYTVNVTNPPLFASEQLLDKIREVDIIVRGVAEKGETPLTAQLLLEEKIELRELIKLINKNSNNFLAECLFKTIGAVASSKQGNSFYSTQAILTFIEDNGIYSKGTSIVDGSGISRFDQITTGAIVGLLEIMYFDLKNFDDYYNSLSIAGVDGTLNERMYNTAAGNNFRGKTGTLNGVSSLSGYLETAGGDDLIISIIFEFERGRSNTYRSIQDEIIEILAGWKEESPEELLQQGSQENTN